MLEPIYELCPGSPGDQAILQTGLDPEPYRFTWFGNGIEIQGEQSPSYTSTQAGNYEVRIEELETGCSFTKTTEVILAVPPEGFEIITRPDTFSKTYEVTLSTGQEMDYLFSLDGGAYQNSRVFSGVLAGSHRLNVATTGGCEVLQTTFSVLGYPAFFTPNGDNVNEAWSVSSSSEITNMTVYIFNRFGALITVLNGVHSEWNGSFNGRDLPSDTYWFRVDYMDNGTARSAKGYFALKR
jgi:gliding motility-associated-like protein